MSFKLLVQDGYFPNLLQLSKYFFPTVNIINIYKVLSSGKKIHSHCQATRIYHLATMSALDFPQWLQDRLDERNWRSTELARRSNLSDAGVSRILRGERKADPETLQSFAKALKIPVKVLYQAAGLLPDDPEADPWVDEMAHKLKLIPPNLRNAAGKLIESMAEGDEASRKPKPKAKTATR